MNGCGNDYIFVNADLEKLSDAAETAQRLSNRNFGIGSDGLVLYGVDKDCNEDGAAQLYMRIFNSDGSEGSTCGNALRCLGRLAKDEGLVENSARFVEIATKAGVSAAEYCADGEVRVTLGEAAVAAEKDGFTVVDIGNKHGVVFAARITLKTVKTLQRIAREYDINAEAAVLESRNRLKVAVWERGSGATLACGSGAAAAAYLSYKKGFTDNIVTVSLPGGTLEVTIEGDKVSIYGKTAYNFIGAAGDTDSAT